MILDNENENLKVHEWISKYTQTGKLSIVTGYFTVGVLAYLSKETRDKIDEYKFILGDIVNFDTDKDRALDLLNEEINIDASLKLSKVAQEAVAFLELDKVKAKTLEPNFCHAKAYLYKHNDKDPQKDYYISGSSNLTEAGVGLKTTNNVELNIGSFGSDPQYNELIKWFDSLWSRPQAHDYKTVVDGNGGVNRIPFKKYLIDEIKKIFTEYSPKQLYFKVLFELFGDELLLEKDNPEFNRQIGRLENTVIYNSLYEFQQKGVLSLIKMLQKHNGAILADAVGLGKTWTALAVLKFFEMKGYKSILLCPKKLENNWNKFLEVGNKFEKDNFEYKIRFHTDLVENRWDSYTRRDSFTIQQMLDDKPKILVIDESHNLRNNKSNRYKYLIDEILSKSKGEIKVLMLSATPINNSLMDIRNQFKLIVGGNAKGFEESLDIKNIDYTFRAAQKAFNEWTQEPEPKIGEFIKKLPPNFFKLTDSLTVARTRKMIEGHQDGLEFPKKSKPENIFVTPKQIGNFESFEELFDHFPPMLSGYQPSFYIEEFEDADVLHDEKQRDHFLVKMMYILMVKRLESSWFSFQSTVEKILAHHQNALDRIKQYQETKKETGWNEAQPSLFDDDEILAQIEDFTLGKKRKTRLVDIDSSGNIENYKKDLNADIKALLSLQSNLDQFAHKIDKEIKKPANHNSEDDKLEALINRIVKKRQAGENGGNAKVLIFTVYKDTAFYLFEQLIARGFDKVAAISGDTSMVWNEEGETKRFEPILERFAPFTKLFKEKEWQFEPSSKEISLNQQFDEWQHWIAENDKRTYEKLLNPIDILIATDALSEGQNLQDCDLVINYDIHWNPVRVIQRMGRIDRLGSPNTKIFGINFWPSNNINSYLNLQGRIEQRMATMRLAGAEVNLDFSDTFKEMAEDENLEQKQKARMLEQMQSSWDEIDTEKSLGFDDFSLETFRQELLEELRKNEEFYKSLPNGIYTGFKAIQEVCPQEGMIALLGYPSKPAKANNFEYKGHELIYIDHSGKSVFLNQKEVLDALAKHKDEIRFVPKAIDQGEPKSIEHLSAALSAWLKSQATEEEVQEDGTVKQKMGKASLDMLNKLKTGSKTTIQKLKDEGSTSQKFNKDNFDLITWFIIS
ncbi:MAG TPA: helicase-related protein [Chitinophagaceae bacterium]|nr:MAG: helicase [Bacteroidetes bacterium OLB11]HMN33559.1 helicase-related protein [Chitinophagaceae bacterium]